MLGSFLVPLLRNYAPNVIRQAGLLAAGWLLQQGFIDAAGAELVAGAILAVGMGGWAYVEKAGLLKKLLA